MIDFVNPCNTYSSLTGCNPIPFAFDSLVFCVRNKVVAAFEALGDCPGILYKLLGFFDCPPLHPYITRLSMSYGFNVPSFG